MSTHAIREVKQRLGGPDVPIQDLFRFDGRTILITGGGGAMALNVASSILELGGDVVCLDRMEQPLPDLWEKANAIADRHKCKIWYHGNFDISPFIATTPSSGNSSDDPTSRIQQTIREVLEPTRYPLRGFVACAGISGGGSSLTFDLSHARRLFDVNACGTFACAQAVALEMQRQNVVQGSMVLIASMSAHVSNVGVDTAIYNASKSAVIQLTRSLAAEWGSRPDIPCIRVNSISPGYIRTRMTADTLKEDGMEELWSQGNMLSRLSEADEYRGPVVFLLSDASSFVTGADLRVDGGHTAW